MKKIYNIFVLLVSLLLTVGLACATPVIPITLNLASDGSTDILVTGTYDQDNGILQLHDQNNFGIGTGLLTVAFATPNVNILQVKDLDTNTIIYPSLWFIPGNIPLNAYDGFGNYGSGVGDLGNEAFRNVEIDVTPGTILSTTTDSEGHLIACHYKRNVNPGTTFFITDGGSTQVPEFPTMALPVTAILGIIIIMGRRKQD